MCIEEFISELIKQDIKMWVEDGLLKCNAPKGLLTPDLCSKISEHKSEIIEFLKKANDITKSASVITTISREKELPLSFAQQRMWFLDQFTPGNPAYNNPIAWRINGDLNLDALKSAIKVIVSRHESLRTTFGVVDGRAFQKIAKEQGLAMPVEDISHLQDSELEDTAMKLVIEEARGPFDLTNGPLFRGRIIKIGHEDYILMLHPHHIISDGWSWSVLFNELEILYKGILRGEMPQLAPLTIQYADFAYYQRQWLQNEVLESRVSYWKNNLENTQPLLKLPLDYPRPKVLNYEGERIHTSISPVLTEKLKILSKEQGVSLFMTLLGIINVQLYMYTGSGDICVGTPTASRNMVEIENLIGLFVNTLVLRTKINEKNTFTELLHEVRDVCLGAYANQDVPFEKLVDELNVERDMSYTPLVQAMFVLQGFRESDLDLQGLKIKPYNFSRGTIRFDLEIYFWEEKDNFNGYFEYNKALFQPNTIKRMIENFHSVLNAVLQNPESSVSSLAQISDKEKNELISHFNDTTKDYAREKTIHRLFVEQVMRTPDNIAVSFDDISITYKELDESSNRLAITLREANVAKGSLVGVIIERSAEMIISVLGILKAGGAYVPIEPYLPDGRIQTVLSSLDLNCLITDSSNLKRIVELINDLPKINAVICMGDKSEKCIPFRGQIFNWKENSGESIEMVENLSDAEDIAYIIFTSGSTGTPKGVVVRHRPVINMIEWVNKTFAICENDKGLFITSLSFDLSVYDIFGILATGGTVRLVGTDDIREPARLLDIIYNEDITFWNSAPQALQQLVPFFEKARGKKSISKIKHVFLSGDWIPVTLPDKLKSVFQECEVIALGGATEATVWSNYYRVGKVEPWWPSIPYGKPIQNAKYYILDKYLRPCPFGVPGDLYIGGECLASGYINDEELTANKFVQNPFVPGEKMYKTGDLARWLEDGNMEFLGRADFQVKVRGYRVELGEIESILLKHDQVKEAFVFAKKDASGNNYLVAYYVLGRSIEDGTKRLTPDEIKGYLSKYLPGYMVPSYFAELEQMPLTSNGKLDRNALLSIENNAAKVKSQIVLPSNDIQNLIADIWKQVLNRDKVGIYDNFFDLGGNSLSIVEVNYKINKTFNKNITVLEMFRHVTIDSLADFIANEGAKQQAKQEQRIGSINQSINVLNNKLKIMRGR